VSNENVFVIRDDDLPLKSDNIHRTGYSLVVAGERMAAIIKDCNSDFLAKIIAADHIQARTIGAKHLNLGGNTFSTVNFGGGRTYAMNSYWCGAPSSMSGGCYATNMSGVDFVVFPTNANATASWAVPEALAQSGYSAVLNYYTAPAGAQTNTFYVSNLATDSELTALSLDRTTMTFGFLGATNAFGNSLFNCVGYTNDVIGGSFTIRRVTPNSSVVPFYINVTIIR
jgi:hypothetical protein